MGGALHWKETLPQRGSPQGGPLQRPGRLLRRQQHERRRRPPPHFLSPPAGTGGRGTRAGIRGRSGRAAGLRVACARLSPPSAPREEDLQQNSATISALPRKVMPCSRESCSAMARPTDDGTRFHPADSDARGFGSSSPPLVSKGTTRDALAPFAQARSASSPPPPPVVPFAQARRASRPRLSRPLRRREMPLDPPRPAQRCPAGSLGPCRKRRFAQAQWGGVAAPFPGGDTWPGSCCSCGLAGGLAARGEDGRSRF